VIHFVIAIGFYQGRWPNFGGERLGQQFSEFGMVFHNSSGWHNHSRMHRFANHLW